MAFHRVVLLGFPEPLPAEDASELHTLLGDGAAVVDGLLSYSFGSNLANSKFSHGLRLVFSDADAHARYLPHPAHAAIASWLQSRNLVYELLLMDD